MSDHFRQFIEAETREILDSMDEDCRCNPDRCRARAIEWIEKNAEFFREQWNLRHEFTGS